MLKVLARQTNNAEQFFGQRGKFNCEHFTKFCIGLYETFSFHRFNISSFFVCFNVVELVSFRQILKYVTYVKIFHEAKLQAFVEM